jgi:hypothetical protein
MQIDLSTMQPCPLGAHGQLHWFCDLAGKADERADVGFFFVYDANEFAHVLYACFSFLIIHLILRVA